MRIMSLKNLQVESTCKIIIGIFQKSFSFFLKIYYNSFTDVDESIIIELFVGKENNNHNTIYINTENSPDQNINCIILNSFVLSLGMLLHFFPAKLSGADREITRIEKITIQ